MRTKEIKFSIPYNGDLGLVKWAIESGKVYEVYFAGRRTNDFSSLMAKDKDYSDESVFSLIEFCNKRRIKTNLLLNKGIMLFENRDTVANYINSLDFAGGIDSVTVADPFIIPYLKKTFPNLKIHSSVYMGINSIQKAVQALKKGVSVLNLEPSLNRNFVGLKNIMGLKKKFPDFSVKLLSNHICYADCMYYTRHAQVVDLSRIMDKDNKELFAELTRCHYGIQTTKEEIARTFIRPEDVGYYEKNQLTDYIKIAFRNKQTPVLQRTMEAYFRRSYKGDLFELFDTNNPERLLCDNKKIPRGFIEKVMNCDKNCEFCTYCSNVAKRCVIKKNRGQRKKSSGKQEDILRQ